MKTKVKDYLLTITPALPIADRHKIGRFLDGLDYDVIGSGQMTDGSECDISFFNRKDLPLAKGKKK